MLAGRSLPTVPEEDFFPDVEDAAALPPPSSSPPSVSTPTPTAHMERGQTRLATPPNFYAADQPPSPQMFSPPGECFIPTRQSPAPEATPAHISPTPPTHRHSEPDVKFVLRQEETQKPFTRSRSAQELLQARSDPRGEGRGTATAPLPSSPLGGLGPPFVVPKVKAPAVSFSLFVSFVGGNYSV